MSNLRHSNGKLWIQNHLDQVLIHADASKKGWGAVCKGVWTGGLWPKEEQLLHINVLELTMIALSRDIWEVLFKKNLTISAEHLPSALNMEADWESQNSRDSSDWKLSPLTFQRIKSRFGHPLVDLLASHLYHQLEKFFSWRPDPHNKGVDAMQQKWSVQVRHISAFPPSSIPRVLQKIVHRSLCNGTCSANLADTALVPQAFTILKSHFNYHTSYTKSTANWTKGGSSISSKQNIKVTSLESFRESIIDSWLSESATSLTSRARRPSSNSNHNSSWRKWVSWCSRKEIDPVWCSVNFILDFLAEPFELGALLRGAFTKKLPQPIYAFTWDVQVALDFVKNKWDNSNS